MLTEVKVHRLRDVSPPPPEAPCSNSLFTSSDQSLGNLCLLLARLPNQFRIHIGKQPAPRYSRNWSEVNHSLPGLGAPTRCRSLPSPVRLTPGLNVSSAPGPRAPREGTRAATLSLRPSDAPTTPHLGGRAPAPAAAGGRGVPTATNNQRVEHRAAILARGHCACATRLKEASRGQLARTQRRRIRKGVEAGARCARTQEHKR